MYHKVAGVDPGLVDTGVVLLAFYPVTRELVVSYTVIHGPDPAAVAAAIGNDVPHIFIEGYKPRSHFGTDSRMIEAVGAMKKELKGSKVLLNTGVKKVVRRPLMEALECWTFPVSTHHGDLRSAARILLLGMMKDDTLNEVLSDFVRDYVDGRAWHVVKA